MTFAPPTGEPTSTNPPGWEQGYVIRPEELLELAEANAEQMNAWLDSADWLAYTAAESAKTKAHAAALEVVLLNIVKAVHKEMGYESFADAVHELVLLRSDLVERTVAKSLEVIKAKVAKPADPRRGGYL